MAIIDLVTGLLGSGKTTFISKYCDYLHKNGVHFAVIENEFGSAGVDTAILRSSVATVKELSGGCICCSLKVDFVQMLIELSSYDRIIVEPSGIFTLEDFYEAALSPGVKACCSIGAVLTIVEPLALTDGFLCQESQAIFLSQLLATGLVVASKTEALPRESFLAGLRQFAADINGDRVLVKNWDDFNDEDFRRIQAVTPLTLRTEKPMVNHALLYNSCTLYPKAEYTQAGLEEICERVFDNSCGDVLRMKGYVKAFGSGCFILNCTKGVRNITSVREALEPMVNVIGRNLKRKEIKKWFDETYKREQ